MFGCSNFSPHRLIGRRFFLSRQFKKLTPCRSLATQDQSISDKKIRSVSRNSIEPLCSCDDPSILSKCSKSEKCQYRVDKVPVYIKTYGCQMNVNDTSIVGSILQDYGYRLVQDDFEAEIHLLMTCAIRDSAESKIWGKLKSLKAMKDSPSHPLKQIGLLGCMAERLKEKVLENSSGLVDIVAGPDAYRDLPRLFAVNKMTNDKAINCLLSFDETYSDIRPVTNINDVTAYISITRGCDNLCSYCIVPFTRGRERSRPMKTILDEAKLLSDKGVKDVTLLGQNVNSYRDLITAPESLGRLDLTDKVNDKESFAKGFKTVYKPRTKGLTFDVLLEEVAKISPELRVRFTSPHPKDFTDDVIDVIRRYPNISKCIHLPAQSGSDRILEKMRRGYTKQTYLELVQRLRASVPDVALTSDFITGFCGETEEDHQETLDLIRKDDVGHSIKIRRTQDIIAMFRKQADELNHKLIGTEQLILVESESKRSDLNWRGRIDSNIKTILPKCEVLCQNENLVRPIKPGDYVVGLITESNSQTLKARPLRITSQSDYHYGDDQIEFNRMQMDS